MLKILMGVAKSGKTKRVFKEIEKRAKEGKHSILLVPEQYSSSAEIMVYMSMGDRLSAFVQTLSFRTIAGRIMKACGGADGNLISDAGRVVFVRRATDVVADKLNVFARQQRSMAFCDMAAKAIHELKTAGVSPEDLEKTGAKAGEDKLCELALIYNAYEALIKNSAMDPEDLVSLSAEKAADCGLFDGYACFIDNFDGFTAPEYKMISSLLTVCDEVTVSLCCDGLSETDHGLGLFSPVRKTAARIWDLARSAGVRTVNQEIIRPDKNHDVLHDLNRLLCGEEISASSASSIYLNEYQDEYEEANCVAAKILSLARQGTAFSKIAVVCRDIEKYKNGVEQSFEVFGIPVFIDAVGNIEHSSVIVFIRSALRLLKGGLSSQPILEIIKTDLCGYNKNKISALENYVFTWNPKAADWRGVFDKNPAGMLMDEIKEEDRQQLEYAEELRADVVPKLEAFISACKKADAKMLSRQLYLLMARFSAAENLGETAAVFEEGGKARLAENLRRSWDLAIDLLDQMSNLLVNEDVSAAEYDELFLILVRGTDFGQVAQSLECVVFTSADRMRLSGIEHCFVMGLNEGDFPMQVGYSGLLTHADRDLLVAEDKQIPGSFQNRILLEQMFFYRALTTALKCLYLSYPKRMRGAQKSISSALEPVEKAFSPAALELKPEDFAQTPTAAFSRLCSLYRRNSSEAACLMEALSRREQDFGSSLSMLQSVNNSSVFRAGNISAVERLVGKEMYISPTRAESFYQCAFSYFLERVLGVRPRRKAEISPMESGTFVHYVLEMVVSEAGADFGEYEDRELKRLCDFYSDKFTEENLPIETLRDKNLILRIKASIYELILYMRDSLAQSDFDVAAVELEISDGEGAVKPLIVETQDGRRLKVGGKIDRVDIMQRDGTSYVCIVDYKTGSKEFKLAEVFCGLNMQMLIYMHTLIKNGKDRFGDLVPGGVLYVMADPAPKSGSRDNELPMFEIDGIVLQDKGVLKALDKEGDGLFLPMKHKNGVASKASSKIADLERMGRIESHIEDMLCRMATDVYGGKFDALPYVNGDVRPCNWCKYKAVCRHEDGRNERPVKAPDNAFSPPAEEADEAEE